MVTIDDVVNDISLYGLMTAEQLEEFQLTLTSNPGELDAELLVSALVKKNKLTSYQAAMIKQGKCDQLVFGDYVVLVKIAKGGMGSVFKAKHKSMNRLVALKTLPPGASLQASAIERFRREVEVSARLNHENIVTAFDAGQQGDSHYLVMEFVEGVDLYQQVQQTGPLEALRAVKIAKQTASGLAHAHKNGIIHRDIKPPNLMMDQHNKVKILDMGVARLEDAFGQDSGEDSDESSSILTVPGMMLGSVDFLAPEQAEDASQADRRADIYSLGCSLFYLMTGLSPYRGGSILRTLDMHVNQPIPVLSDYAHHPVPEGLQPIFEKMMAKKRDHRFNDCDELIEALDAYVYQVNNPDVNQGEPSYSNNESGSSQTNPDSSTVETTYTRKDSTYGALLPDMSEGSLSSNSEIGLREQKDQEQEKKPPLSGLTDHPILPGVFVAIVLYIIFQTYLKNVTGIPSELSAAALGLGPFLIWAHVANLRGANHTPTLMFTLTGALFSALASFAEIPLVNNFSNVLARIIFAPMGLSLSDSTTFIILGSIFGFLLGLLLSGIRSEKETKSKSR